MFRSYADVFRGGGRLSFCANQTFSKIAVQCYQVGLFLRIFVFSVVDGNFAEWSQWSICSATCGSAVIHRTRECSNPEPALNGSDCLGLTNEQQRCSVPTICPRM